MSDRLRLKGTFVCVCFDRNGRVKWIDYIENLVVTVSKNLILDTYLAGSAYTVTGPFMGLINNTGFTGIVAGDTMASHAGWQEGGGANAPTYSGDRKTLSFNAAAAGSKTTSAPAAFSITSPGTVKGAFIVLGSGASATKDNTGGTLHSAGLFTGGDKTVDNGDTLNVSYTISL